MPKAHRAQLEWTPTRLIHWGRSVGIHVETMIRRILESRPHPEMSYRSCLGILRLEKRYGGDRLEAACERALVVGACSYRHVASILKHNLDRERLDDASDQAPVEHENVRGPDYYH